MEYFEPNFLNEALVVLDRFGERAKVLAGGTLLGPHVRDNPTAADAIVNIKRIPALSEITAADGGLRIGALATARSLTAPLVVERAPLVARAAASMGAPQLRSVATAGGNLLSAHYSADLSTALLACEARATIATLHASPYELPVERILSPGFSGLGRGALLTDIFIPASNARCAFEKMQTRRAFEMALVSAAVALLIDGKRIAGVRIALGGAAQTPIRATGAEAALANAPAEAVSAVQAARVAAEVDAEPWDDQRASADYRRHLVRVLVERALLAAFAQSPGSSK
jgi:carbon-monoxide dehydrogenase medium subunit